MDEIVIEHVKVSELPESWRKRLAAAEDARVTVRIEQEGEARQGPSVREEADDPLFGMWRDRKDMTDVEDYVRKLRAPRY